MKATIQIPKGYRRLRRGEIIRGGDLCVCGMPDWLKSNCEGFGAMEGVADGDAYIRRIKQPIKKSTNGGK